MTDVQAALATLRNWLPSDCMASLATVEQALTDKDAKYDALVTEAWEDRGTLADAQAEVARLTAERDEARKSRDAYRKLNEDGIEVFARAVEAQSEAHKADVARLRDALREIADNPETGTARYWHEAQEIARAALGEEQKITDAIPTGPMPGWKPIPVESLLDDHDFGVLGEDA